VADRLVERHSTVPARVVNDDPIEHDNAVGDGSVWDRERRHIVFAVGWRHTHGYVVAIALGFEERREVVSRRGGLLEGWNLGQRQFQKRSEARGKAVAKLAACLVGELGLVDLDHSIFSRSAMEITCVPYFAAFFSFSEGEPSFLPSSWIR
jgi:hypothetical protein